MTDIRQKTKEEIIERHKTVERRNGYDHTYWNRYDVNEMLDEWAAQFKSPSVEGQAEAAAGYTEEYVEKMGNESLVFEMDLLRAKEHIEELKSFLWALVEAAEAEGISYKYPEIVRLAKKAIAGWKAGQTGAVLETLNKHCETLVKGNTNSEPWSESFCTGVRAVQSMIQLLTNQHELRSDQCPEINHDPVVVNEIEETIDFDAMRVQQAKERLYWQKRCEAAEALIEIMPTDEYESYDRYQQWQELKNKEVK